MTNIQERLHTAKTLRDAADLIEEVGFVKDKFVGRDYSTPDHEVYGYCVLGAIGEVEGVGPHWIDRDWYANKAVRTVQDYLGVRVQFWNDRWWRTQKQAVKMLRKVADKVDPNIPISLDKQG